MKLRKIKTLGLSVLAAMTIMGCQLDNKVSEIDVSNADSAMVSAEDGSKSVVSAVRFYSSANGKGQMYVSGTTRALGNCANLRWPNGASMDNSINSILIPAGVYISVTVDLGFKGAHNTFQGSGTGKLYNMSDYGFANQISSFEIHKNSPNNLSYKYLSNYPSSRENGWSNECQGVTTDGERWFISTKWNVRRIHRSLDLNASHNDKIIFRRPFNNSDNHIGDITYYNGEIYIPVEHCPGLYPNRMYAYNVKTGAVRWAYIPQQSHLSWVAINPDNGLMYSCNSDSNALLVYNRNFANGSILRANYYIPMSTKLTGIQGGVFDNNNYLYLSKKSGSGGIYVFQLFGFSAIKKEWISPNGYSSAKHEEMEGLTWWDLDQESNVHPKVAGGQLHWMLLDNDANDDDIIFKHVRVSWK